MISGRPSEWSSGTTVIFDDHSISSDGWDFFVPRYILSAQDIKAIIPSKVVEKLNSRYAKGSGQYRRIQSVRDMISKGHMRVAGEYDDPTEIEPLFKRILLSRNPNAHTVIVTQNESVAEIVLRWAKTQSRCGAYAIRIGHLGVPEEWRLDKHNKVTAFQFEKPFKRSNDVRMDSAKAMVPEDIPGENDTVLTDNGVRLRLTGVLGRGGEGTTYATDIPDIVCKIYAQGKLHRSTVEKLRLMTSRRIEHRGICWPTSLAYTGGQVVGYVMPRAKGVELARSVFMKPLFMQRFPHWNRAHLVELAISVLDAILYLHTLNVLIGDINGRNILVQDERTLSFVDCDSFQVEGFPCPVGAPPFLAARLAGCNLGSTLRSEADEHFAIATLIFMILFMGKPPYSHEGGGDPFENVRAKVFPYQLGDRGAKKAPAGPWKFMFSHLPYRLKDMFHRVFRGDEDIRPLQWHGALVAYRSDLRRGYLSTDLFPSTYKQLRKKEQVLENGGWWLTCKRCGKGFGVFPKRDQEAPHDSMCPDSVCLECARERRVWADSTQPASRQRANGSESIEQERTLRHNLKPRESSSRMPLFNCIKDAITPDFLRRTAERQLKSIYKIMRKRGIGVVRNTASEFIRMKKIVHFDDWYEKGYDAFHVETLDAQGKINVMYWKYQRIRDELAKLEGKPTLAEKDEEEQNKESFDERGR